MMIVIAISLAGCERARRAAIDRRVTPRATIDYEVHADSPSLASPLLSIDDQLFWPRFTRLRNLL
jgi:hypothetical protein